MNRPIRPLRAAAFVIDSYDDPLQWHARERKGISPAEVGSVRWRTSMQGTDGVIRKVENDCFTPMETRIHEIRTTI